MAVPPGPKRTAWAAWALHAPCLDCDFLLDRVLGSR